VYQLFQGDKNLIIQTICIYKSKSESLRYVWVCCLPRHC